MDLTCWATEQSYVSICDGDGNVKHCDGGVCDEDEMMVKI